MRINNLKYYLIKIVFERVRHKHYLFLCVLTVIMSITTAQSLDHCKTKSGCSGLCSTCDLGYCVFTYKYRFDKYKYCSLFYRENITCMGSSSGNRSDVTTCNSPDGGKCDRIEDSYRESCVCRTGYYGDTCQHKNEGGGEGMVSSVTVKHIDFVNPAEEHKLEIVLIGETMLDVILFKEITVSTNEGYYRKLEPSDEIKSDCPWSSVVCMVYELTDFKVSFKQYKTPIPPEEPGQRYDSDGDQWFSPDSDEIGGVRRNIGLKITVVQDDVIHSSTDFDMFVNYGAFERVVLKCVPSVLKITNCERQYQNSLKYKRSSAIVMEHEVIFLENGGFVNQSNEDKSCVKNAKLFWRIARGFDSTEEKHLEDVKESRTEDIIQFEPFSLYFGIYRAYLEWSVIQQNVVKNFAYCYFQVIQESLVAIISGGDERVVASNRGLVLSAAESYDPNYRRSDKEQLMLTTQWYCKREPHVEDPLCGRWTNAQPISTPYVIPPGLLKHSAVYKFRVFVSSKASHHPKAAFAYVRIQVTPEGPTENFVYIKCVHNCGNIVIPNQIIYITAERANTLHCTNCKWVYYRKDNETEEKPTDSIMELNLPPHMLIIKEDTLERGVEYIIEAREHSTGAFAKYSFRTAKLVYEGNCTVEPAKGIKGETDFDVVCTHYATLLYEFYDKTPEEASEDIIFSGRMLGSSSDGKLRKVKLSRGTVLVYALDANGLFVSKKVQVELSDSKDSDILSKYLRQLTVSLKRHTDVANYLRLISVIADLTRRSIDKSVIFYTLYYAISEAPRSTMQDVKLSISTLNNILVSINRPVQLIIKTTLLLRLQSLVKEQSDILKLTIRQRYTRWTSPRDVRQICKYILNCLYVTFRSRDKETEGLDPDDFRFKDLIELKYCSEVMEDTIDNVKDTLSALQVPGQPPSTVSVANDSLVVWVMSNDDDEMPFNRTLTKYTVIPVEISDGLQETLNKFQGGTQLFLQVMSIKENIFWWSKSDISSNLLSISIVSKKLTEEDELQIETVKTPLVMRLNITALGPHKIVIGTAIQLDPTLDPAYLDLNIVVHRIDIPPGSVATLNFILSKRNESWNIFASPDARPDYKSVKESSVLISGESPTFTIPFPNNIRPLYVYIGILPGSEVSVNQSITYTFKVYTKVCQTWRKGIWSPLGCRLTAPSTWKYVYCWCDHLSVFGVGMPVAAEEERIFEDFNLFLTVLDNSHVIGLIGTILLIYLISCLTVRCRDNLDTKMQKIIVLEDNCPGDTYPYLIVVYTSPRYNAGTTAHVGFRLIGTGASSRAHVFRFSDQTILRQGCDDWFLIFTKDFLERLSSMHLWHDNAGQSPTWFCNKIFVYDLTDNEKYHFVIDEWMSLQTNCYPEVMSLPVKEKDVQELKRAFFENVYYGMKEIHMLLSIIYSHPRSTVTRVQRVSMCMCGLMVSLLCSIAYYTPEVDNVGFDVDQFSFTLKELLVTLQNLLVNCIVTWIALILFRKARKYQKPSGDCVMTHLDAEERFESTSVRRRGSRRSKFESICTYGDRKFMPKTISNYKRIVITICKFPSLAPVHMPYTDPMTTRKDRLIIAWVFCVSVILVCSSVVMWYGFDMGSTKSKQWLSTVLFSMGTDFFLFSPAKILIYSVFLSSIFQKIYEVNTYTLSSRDMRFARSQVRRNGWQKLSGRRSSRMYAPLDSQSRNEFITKYEELLKGWMSIDFMISASFVIVTSAVVFRLWSAYYFNNFYILNVITKSILPYMHSHDFFSVQNIYDLGEYLEHTFIYSIYCTRWYNNDPMDEGFNSIAKYWLIDGKNRMIGCPKVRQLRVVPQVVRNHVMPPFSRIPDWSTATEDTDAYSDYWQPGSWRHIRKNESAWMFSESTLPAVQTLFRLYSSSDKLYHNGGYCTTLGPTRIDAEYILVDLQNSRWQTERTRVVFAELTVYNVNYDLFTQVTLMTEFLASGQVLLKALGVSLPSSLSGLGWQVTFVLYIIYYIVRGFCLANEQGFAQCLLDIRNVLRIIVIALSVAVLAHLGLHVYTSTIYSSNFQKENVNVYFDFDVYALYFLRMKTILSLVFVVAIFYALSHMHFGTRFTNPPYVIFISFRWLFWMCLTLYVLIFTLINITYLLNISTAFFAGDMMLIHQLMRQVYIADYKCNDLEVFTFATVVSICLVKVGFIVQFFHTVKLVKANSRRYSTKYNIALFLVSKLKRGPQTENTV